MEWLVRTRLESVCVQRDKIFEQLAKVRELRRNLGMFLSKAPSLVQVNVGCDFYVDGEVDEEALLLVDIGKDLYLELQPQEALETAIIRENVLEKIGEFYTKR
ncbi:prefoldin, putative isoform 2 [Galdieria sulphuraria]|nr:prefoldin, putative isoform 2 [Galdieria sulphuraria]EME32828.1 prefoldin, putative isoform 2 [Galdieria sulphuraria]|eukprot:XP_005709348.1 prefoldin, putative isoform 2 [Galdieria sulphuraria]